MPLIGRFTPYARDVSGMPEIMRQVMWYRNEVGDDWYDVRNALAPGTYVAVDGGVIVAATNDPTMLSPLHEIHRLPEQVDDVESLYGRLYDGSVVTDPPPPRVMVVSSAQAKVALEDKGYLDAVEDALQHWPRKARLWYDNAREWRRDVAYIQGIAAELGLTDEQVDDLFAYAATLNP